MGVCRWQKKCSQVLLRLSKLSSVETAKHDYFNVFLKSKTDIENLLTTPLSEASILIVGCGYRYPDVLLYSHFAKEVYGLDVIDVFYRDGFLALYQDLRKEGKNIFRSLLSTIARRKNLQKNYYRRISDISDLAMNHADINLISYDGDRMPFENSTFDAVLSNTVLQHVLNLEVFFRELWRITKPGGISYHLYHNYYSFSGALLLQYLCVEHPWGHLRGIYETDPTLLNKVTLEQVKKHFSSVFEIRDVFQVGKDHSKKGVHKTYKYEGQEWLTEDIRNELAQFSDEQLLTRSYLIVGTKRKTSC